MRFLLATVLLSACGQGAVATEKRAGSLKVDRALATEDVVKGIIRKQAMALGNPEWASVFAEHDVVVTAVVSDYVECNKKKVGVGCTHFEADGITEVRVSMWPWMSVNDTALEHELRHMYLCVFNSDCDTRHLAPEWMVEIK